MSDVKNRIEMLKGKTETLFLELYYIKLEWKLMRKIDETWSKKGENHIENFKTVVFSIKDSLWYSVIMRLSKMLDNRDNEKKSLLKVLNCINNDHEIEKLNIFDKKDIEFMLLNLNNYTSDINEKGEIIELFKEVRDNYFAHLDDFNSPFEAQKEVFIGEKRINILIDECSNIIEYLCNKLNIEIIANEYNFELLEREYDIVFDIIERSYNE